MKHSMSKSRIRDYLPLKPKERVNVQAKVDKALVDEVRTLLTKDGLGWNDLITASLKTYLDESRSKKSA